METTSPSVHDNIRTEALSNKTLQGALQVVREFLEYWNPAIFTVVSQSIIITPSVTHVTHMCMITAKDGLSVVAIDTTNNKVVGVAFNKIRRLDIVSSTVSYVYADFLNNVRSMLLQKCITNLNKMEFAAFPICNLSFPCIMEMTILCDKKPRTEFLIFKKLVSHTMDLGNALLIGINIRVPVTIDDDSTVTNDNCVPHMLTIVEISNLLTNCLQSAGFTTFLKLPLNELFRDYYTSKMHEKYVKICDNATYWIQEFDPLYYVERNHENEQKPSNFEDQQDLSSGLVN